MNKYDALKLENQLCFPLYACSKEIIRKYKPYLDPLNLTYTQYLVMLVLWEFNSISSKELGNKLYLDSGTLTPVLNKLKSQGLLTKKRDKNDARNLLINLTEKGEKLKEEAVEIPAKLGGCISLDKEDLIKLYPLLYKLLDSLGG